MDKIKAYLSSDDLELVQLGATLLTQQLKSRKKIINIITELVTYPFTWKLHGSNNKGFTLKISRVEDTTVVDLWNMNQKTTVPLMNLNTFTSNDTIFVDGDTYKFELPYGTGKDIPTII